MTTTVRTKNPMAKTRNINHPYRRYVAGGWEWRVLKSYQAPENERKNPYARWLCAVQSPYTFGSYDMGDTYIRDIPTYAERRDCICVDVDNSECPMLRLEKW